MLPSEFKAIKALVETLRKEMATLRQVGAEQVSAIGDQKEAAEKCGADIARAIAAIQPTEAAQREDRTYRHKNYTVQVVLMVATCGAFVAAAIYAGFAYRTLKEIQKQTPLIKQSATIASDALSNSVASFRTDERAWIEIGDVKFSPWTSNPRFGTIYRYELFPKNVGKTVATNVEIYVTAPMGAYETITSRQAIDLTLRGTVIDSKTKKTFNEPFTPGPETLAPGAVSPVPLIAIAQEPQFFPTGGSNWQELLGKITYLDAFGVHHWMHFCYVVHQGGTLWNCPNGNEEDNNPEPKPN